MTYEQILINGISERDKRIAELEKERAVRDLEQQADELEKPHANTLKPFK